MCVCVCVCVCVCCLVDDPSKHLCSITSENVLTSVQRNNIKFCVKAGKSDSET